MIIRMSESIEESIECGIRDQPEMLPLFQIERKLASRRVESCRVCVTLCRVNCRPKWREKLTMFRDVSRVE